MTLREYLDQPRVIAKWLAQDLGISRTHLYFIATGMRVPSAELAQRIQKATKGQVKADEVRKPCS